MTAFLRLAVPSYLVMGLGWLAFALSLRRTRAYPSWAIGLLVAGSLVTMLPMSSRTLLLSLGVMVTCRTVRGAT